MTPLPDTFAALGDATRFAIVERLLAKGELAAGDLQGIGDISAPAISRHLKVLRNAKIISQRIDKQRRIYSVRPEAMRAVNDWAMGYFSFWQSSLDRLEMALAEREGG